MGCATPSGNVEAGGSCTRTIECAAGLACNGGICTTDLEGLGHGMLPMLPMDAGPIDAAVEIDAAEPVDAYIPPGTDAWAPDAYEPPVDAFVPPVDAYEAPVDAFVPTVDAAADEPDAWTPDAAEEPDAG